MVTDPEDKELRRLQRRAYGSDADIVGDVAAIERLNALEARRRGSASVEEQTRADALALDSEPQPVLRPPRWRGRLLAAVIALGCLAGGAILIMSPLGDTFGEPRDEREVARLRADSDLAWPTQIGPDFGQLSGGVRYQDYLGVAVVSLLTHVQGSSIACVYLFLDEREGADAGGCGSSPTVAETVLIVTDSMPDALQREHPPGTVLRFLLQEDRVTVSIGP